MALQTRCARGVASLSPPSHAECGSQNRVPLIPFRINTCKSVTKQTTLSTCRMNTYAKTGGGILPAVHHSERHHLPHPRENSPPLRRLALTFLGGVELA